MQRTKIFHLVEATQVGVRQHVVTLLSRLNPDRYELTLGYSPRRADALFWEALPKLKARGVKTVELDMVREINPLRDFLALRKLLSEFHRNRYDIVQTHSAKAGFLGRLAARRAGVPVVIHRPAAWSFLATRSPVLRHTYVQLERHAARWTDAIICVSRQERELGLKNRIAPVEKFTVIPNGIDVAGVTGDRARARRALGLPPDAIVLGTITRLTYQKDPLGLIAALAPLLRQQSNLTLVFVGSGPLERTAKSAAAHAGIARQVIFLGFRPDATQLLFGFDVFLLPSRYEGLSYAMLEAMAAGLPIITTAGGNQDAVTDGANGFIVPVGNHAGLRTVAARLANDATLRRQMGDRARQRVNDFTVERQVEQTAALYDRLLKAKGL